MPSVRQEVIRKKILSSVAQLFFQGVVVLAPIGVTIWVVVSLFNWVDNFLPNLLNFIFPLQFAEVDGQIPKVTGLGFVVAITLVLFIGWLSSLFFVERLMSIFDKLLEKTPGVKIIYSSVKDFLEAFAGNKKKFDKPVLVNVDVSGVWRIGFITQPTNTEFGLPDHVTVYIPHSYAISGITYIIPKTNIKLHVWAQQGIDGHLFDSPLEQKALKNITCVISNSINGANFLKSIGVKDSIIHVVYNGIDTNLPLIDSSEWVKRLNPKPNSFNAIMVANITKLKDHITLVKAWKIVVEELKNENIEANLYLAGREDNQAEVTKQTIEELDLKQNIHILGVVKDVYNLVKMMDVAILSSPSEGLPNAILECMLLAKPFVGTNIEGIKEAVGLDNYEYLSNYQDEKTLATNILKFAQNKNLATAVGEKNKKWVETQFPISKLWNETHQIINWMLTN